MMQATLLGCSNLSQQKTHLGQCSKKIALSRLLLPAQVPLLSYGTIKRPSQSRRIWYLFVSNEEKVSALGDDYHHIERKELPLKKPEETSISNSPIFPCWSALNYDSCNDRRSAKQFAIIHLLKKVSFPSERGWISLVCWDLNYVGGL